MNYTVNKGWCHDRTLIVRIIRCADFRTILSFGLSTYCNFQTWQIDLSHSCLWLYHQHHHTCNKITVMPTLGLLGLSGILEITFFHLVSCNWWSKQTWQWKLTNSYVSALLWFARRLMLTEAVFTREGKHDYTEQCKCDTQIAGESKLWQKHNLMTRCKGFSILVLKGWGWNGKFCQTPLPYFYFSSDPRVMFLVWTPRVTFLPDLPLNTFCPGPPVLFLFFLFHPPSGSKMK